MKLFLPLFLFLSGCVYDCTFWPGLTQDIEKPKNVDIDLRQVLNDPIHNVAIMSECKYLSP